MIYIHKNNQQIGPFEESTVMQMVNNGQLSPRDMACRQGSSQWKPLMVVVDEAHPEAAIIERESKLYDVYSDELTSILQHWSEADDGTAKQLKKQYEQKLQIAEKHAYSLKQQFPNVFEVRIIEADVLYNRAMLKINERGFFNSASGTLLARGRQKRSLTSTSLGAATRMIANHQEKNNAMEAIRLLEQSISVFDTPGARLAKAHILHSLKQNDAALQELNYVIGNFQDDDMYLPARQLKDEIENPPKKGMCFVATAAYGSPLAPEVEIFRSFRDETLLKSKFGVSFVEIYYCFSPPVANVIARWAFLRAFTRVVLLSPILRILKTKKAKTVKSINIWFLLLVSVYLISLNSIYAQKQKRVSSKPIAISPQPKQTPPVTKTENQNEQKHLANANIIQMIKGGFGESIILSAIETNETQFDVSINALFELKNAGVSQKIIEAMQFAVKSKRQAETLDSNKSIQTQNRQSPSAEHKNLTADTQGLPTYGTIKDIKDFNRIYISVENAQSRERIVKALGKAPQYQIVSDPQDAQIFLEYKVLSRDDRSDTSDTDLRIKSQMNAVVIKDNKRVITWSETVDHVRKTLGGIGWRSTHNEIKLTERFLKSLKEY